MYFRQRMTCTSAKMLHLQGKNAKQLPSKAFSGPVYNTIVTKRSYQDMVKTLNGILYPEIYAQPQV